MMVETPDTTGKDLVGLLDILKPIADPAPISMWPATTAWIWLSLAVLGVLAAVTWRAWRHWRANAYRRAALLALDRADNDPRVIATVLRRAALAAYPRHQVASLLGPEWLRFLDDTSGGAGFSSPVGSILARAAYREEAANPELTRLARKWVKTHRVKAGS